MDLLSQQPLFSTEQETKGFDLSSGNKWIYPDNYPIREYQFTIVNTSLFHNTLVCLPTGLGKTFIAAVVMYNFWRWYPSGLIVFLAPTKPLVAQQIDACHDIMGIPISETIELTGATNQKQREIAWRNKRVIFATPQTFQKDLEKGIVKTELIKCVVIDEAHRALGNHSYCESIRLLHRTNRYHRLLALSATPGGKLDAVQNVIRNLHITHLELRDDTSPDITPYINERKLEIIQVGLGNDLTRFQERYIEIMDPYFRVLLKNNVLRGATSNITKGRIFHIRKEFMSQQNKPYNFGSIVKTLNILLSMCHANDLLINHGLRAFVHFYQNHSDKFWLRDEPNLLTLVDEIKEFIGPFPEIQSLVNGDATTIPDNIVFGHEKFNKLREILMTHFNNAAAKNADTRAIVFIEYRDIVNEVFILLLQLRPLIRPQVFVGQAGLKQKQQKKALDDFRNNHVNVLISTSVGEEGLDVGEVDLIICFDILQHSPTRLVQRMGRTGRKRDGHIIILVTDGREQKTLKSALAKRDSLNNKVLHSSGIIDALGEESPRMIPAHLNPECLKMRITAIPTTPRTRKQRKQVESRGKQNDINDNEKKVPKNTKSVARNKTNISKTMPNAMMKFLAASSNQDNITQDDDVVNMRIEEVHSMQLQSQSIRNNLQRLKPSDIKLLTSDEESVEFLTMCTLKQSAQDMNNDEQLLSISYVPEFYFESSENHVFDFDIPPLSILNCIKTLDEYIVPVADEFTVNEPDDAEMWQSDHFSHFAEISHCPELVLTNGRFEDLLDDTSDSDQTIFSGDQSFLDQQVDWGNNENPDVNIVQQKRDGGINGNTLTNSIVIGGAFEDLLDESSDESVIQIPTMSRKLPQTYENNILDNAIKVTNTKLNPPETDVIPVINITTPEPDNLTEHENNPSKKNSSLHAEYVKDKQGKNEKRNVISPMEVDVNLDLDFKNDFSSWDDSSLSKILSNSMKTQCTNVVKSRHNTPIDFPNSDAIIIHRRSQRTQEIDGQIINTNISTSPDLSKSSQRRVQTTLNMFPNACEQQSTSFRLEEETVGGANPTDDDIFGVESLLLDSDSENQLTTVEKFNAVEVNNLEDKSNIYINPLVKEVNSGHIHSEQKIVNGFNAEFARDNSVSNIDLVDDLQWSSDDFETSSAPITKSKYFESNCDRTSRNSFHVSIPNIPEDSRGSRMGTNEKENENSNKNSTTKKKLPNIREKFLTRVKSNSRQNDSDDDFAPKKIETSVFRELKNSFSDEEIFSDNPSRLVAGNCSGNSSNAIGPKSLSTRDSSEFVMPKTFRRKPKIPSVTRPLTIETRSSSLDGYSNTTHRVKRRGRMKSAFIDDEAKVCSDETHSPGSSGDEDETDDELANFVSHSQYHDTAVDMRAHYLQSVRSPRRPGRFFIKTPKTPPPDMQIYSQNIPDEPNSYLYDSFCVGDGELSEHSDHSLEEISILAEAERKLKKRKRKRRNSSGSSHTKRKRIVVNLSDDTSEDETEKMRAEIADQSLILKN